MPIFSDPEHKEHHLTISLLWLLPVFAVYPLFLLMVWTPGGRPILCDCGYNLTRLNDPDCPYRHKPNRRLARP